MRQMLLQAFIMARPQGFLWYDPGIPSITIPYHDTNDFYFSGHVGTAIIYLHYYHSEKMYLMRNIVIFILINEWITLTVLRTHYIIDLVSGWLIAHWSIFLAETINGYFFDVIIMGLSAKKRKTMFHTPCLKCGWNNLDASHWISRQEHNFLKNMYENDRIKYFEKK